MVKQRSTRERVYQSGLLLRVIFFAVHSGHSEISDRLMAKHPQEVKQGQSVNGDVTLYLQCHQ